MTRSAVRVASGGEAEPGRRGPVTYVLIAFGLAWVLWAIPLLGTNVSPRNPLFQLAILPGTFAPAFAAFAVPR